MKNILCYILLALAPAMTLPCNASPADSTLVDSVGIAPAPSRRHITPVKPETNTVLLPGKGVDNKLLEQYLTGDTLKAQEEARRDSVKRAYTRYPKLTDIAVGFNFVDLVLGAAGQDHMNVDVNLTLNMWNRLQPVLELGMGHAKSTPDGKNYTYNGKWSPFARVGANYNFLFKNSPDYQGIVGVRLGGSTFRYEITDIHHHNGYWGEDVTTQITGQKGSALWCEIVAGLKVKIVKQVSLGWQVKFHTLLSEGKSPQGKPWFIPGYGTRGGSLAFAFNAYYTIPLHKSPAVSEKGSIAEE